MILVLFALVAVAALGRLARPAGDRDAPARIVAAAAGWLPAHRQDWGQAMTAELTQLPGGRQRWLFAGGVLRVALLPPPRQPGRVAVVAIAGVIGAAVGTVVTALALPSLAVFVAVLALLLSGYAALAVCRGSRGAGGGARTETPRRRAGPRPPVPRLLAAALALTAATAAIAAVAQIAAAHPAATADPTHAFSVLLAVMLTGYLALALTPPRLGSRLDRDRTGAALSWAAAGALGGAGGQLAIFLATGGAGLGVTPMLATFGALGTLVAAAGAAASTRSRRGGALAGLVCAALSGPASFAISLTALAHVHHFSLTTGYDIAAFPHSGYADVATYVLSDAIAGEIIWLALAPVILAGAAAVGSAVGTRLRRPAIAS